MSTGKITNIKDIEIEALRQRIEFLELQVQGYRQNCERLERQLAEMGVFQRDEPKSCGSCTHFEKGIEFGSPCHQCFNYCNWESAK